MKMLISNISNNIYKIKKDDILIVSKKYKEGIVVSGLTNPDYKDYGEFNCLDLHELGSIYTSKKYQILDYNKLNTLKNISFETRICVIDNTNLNNEIIISNVFYHISGFYQLHSFIFGREKDVQMDLLLPDLKIQHKGYIEGYKEMINQF